MRGRNKVKALVNNLYGVESSLVDLLQDIDHILMSGEKDRTPDKIYATWSMLWSRDVLLQDVGKALESLPETPALSVLMSFVPDDYQFRGWCLKVSDLATSLLEKVSDMIENLEGDEHLLPLTENLELDEFDLALQFTMKSANKASLSLTPNVIKNFWAYFRDNDQKWFFEQPTTGEWGKVLDVVPIGTVDSGKYRVHLRYADESREWFEPVDGEDKMFSELPVKSTYQNYKYKIGQRVYVPTSRAYGKIVGMRRIGTSPLYTVEFASKKKRDYRITKLRKLKPAKTP